MKKYVPLRHLFVIVILCSCGPSRTSSMYVGKSNTSNQMVLENSYLLGDQQQIAERIYEVTKKKLFVPSCGYPATIGMIEGDKQNFSSGVTTGWWMLARHPKTKLWSAVDMYDNGCTFVSISRPQTDSISVVLLFEGEEWRFGYKWVEKSYSYRDHWRRTCIKDCARKRKK